MYVSDTSINSAFLKRCVYYWGCSSCWSSAVRGCSWYSALLMYVSGEDAVSLKDLQCVFFLPLSDEFQECKDRKLRHVFLLHHVVFLLIRLDLNLFPFGTNFQSNVDETLESQLPSCLTSGRRGRSHVVRSENHFSLQWIHKQAPRLLALTLSSHDALQCCIHCV